MFIRYLLFIAIIISFVTVAMILVKDTGETRKKLEKRLKLETSNNNQAKPSFELSSVKTKTKAKPKVKAPNRKK
jgi:sortase (surface protein transpeptidase)